MRTISWADAELVKVYANIRDPAVSYTWATAPAAVGNEGLIVPITGLGGKGSQLFRSDGIRYYPLAGFIDLAVAITQVSVTSAEANDAGGTVKSTTKIALPYSANNGSLMQNGDIIMYMYAVEKSGTGIALRRAISVGTNASAPLSNTTIMNNTTGASSTSYPDWGAFYRKSATSLCGTGRKNLDAWGGPSAANTYDDAADAVTLASSMDTNTMYVDWSLAFATSGAETADQSFMWVRLYCCGPVTG
jgi:hypothetical protein